METASITTILAPLAVLACPVGMGVMMWIMARGAKSEARGSEASRTPARPASVEVLREEHRRLAEEIERLERQQSAGMQPRKPR